MPCTMLYTACTVLSNPHNPVRTFHMNRFYVCVRAQSRSCVRCFVAPWTVACQGPLSMEFDRQEYWSWLHSLWGDLPDPGTEPTSPVFPAVAGRFSLSHLGSPNESIIYLVSNLPKVTEIGNDGGWPYPSLHASAC